MSDRQVGLIIERLDMIIKLLKPISELVEKENKKYMKVKEVYDR